MTRDDDYEDVHFIWGRRRELRNISEYGVSFVQACAAFDDPHRIILPDVKHSAQEERFFCLGKTGDDIITVRYTMRDGKHRIFGAARWRKGRKIYEERNG